MTLAEFESALRSCRIVASVQSSPGSAMEDPDTLWRAAQASLSQGVKVLRMQGSENIRRVVREFDGWLIGLLKVDYPDSEIYITPTRREVEELIRLGCPVIALDATLRRRPGGETLADLVASIKNAGRLAMADCDSEESLEFARAAGCDIFSTTLSGYTSARPSSAGPDLELVRAFAAANPGPVLAEGRIQEPWQCQAALCAGASGVVIGGALNDPWKQTRRFADSSAQAELVGAVDLGGTWLRFAVVRNDLTIASLWKTPIPKERKARLDWIEEKALEAGVTRIGVSAGGTVDPATGEVWEAKDFIPDYRGTVFALPGVQVTALNDGLATAWGHAHRPAWAGKRVAALALGTGVGAGLVSKGAILCGPKGEYPRWNDLVLQGGTTVEEVLGGLSLTTEPSQSQMSAAIKAAEAVLTGIRTLWMPDVIVVSGGVGLSPWMREALSDDGVAFGDPESGLIGAAALALYPPVF